MTALREYQVSDGKRKNTVTLSAATAPKAWEMLYRIAVEQVRDAYDLGFPGLFPGRTPVADRSVDDGEVWVRFAPTTPGKEAWTLRVRRGEFAGQGALL